jgi:hypothetical protein
MGAVREQGVLKKMRAYNSPLMQTVMADDKQEPAPCCELLMIAGESAGDRSALSDSLTHSRESKGPTCDDAQTSVRNGVERETARRSQDTGEEDAQHRRNNAQHRRASGLRDSWKRVGGGKPRFFGFSV